MKLVRKEGGEIERELVKLVRKEGGEIDRELVKLVRKERGEIDRPWRGWRGRRWRGGCQLGRLTRSRRGAAGGSYTPPLSAWP